MTQHTAELISIEPFVTRERIPERPLERKEKEIWHVRATPLDFTYENHTQHDWTLIRDGDIVRIPLCPYRTTDQDLAKLQLVAFDLGQRFRARYPEAVRTHVIIGQPVEDLRPEVDALRFWLGYAVRIR